jgi:PleD family two-component response regulator
MSLSKILIIDDSKTFLMYITELLKDMHDIKLRLILDPRDAVEVAEEFRPDLILTDFEMPHLNGDQICTLLKMHQTLSIIPIMMLTSNNSDDQLIRAISSGADDYMYKSSRKEVVIIKIKSMLRYKKLIEADVKIKRLEAVKALIATSNHEFNNALFISNGFIKKLQKVIPAEHNELLEKIIEMNQRMNTVVKNLDGLEEIDLTGYEGEVKMLKI